MNEFKIHTENKQPPETRRKAVIFRLKSDRFGVYAADEINWFLDGRNAPSESGQIHSYKVV